MELHATIALKFYYLHVEFQTIGRLSLSALVDILLHLTDSGTLFANLNVLPSLDKSHSYLEILSHSRGYCQRVQFRKFIPGR